MKKLFLLAAIAMVVLGLSACNRRQDERSALDEMLEQNPVVATVNGANIYVRDISTRLTDATRAASADELFFAMEEDELVREILEGAVHIAAMYVLYEEFAEQHGIYIDEEGMYDLLNEAENLMSFYEVDTIEELLSLLDTNYGLNFYDRAHMERFLYLFELQNAIIFALLEDDELFAPFEAYMNVLGAKHILITHAESDAVLMGQMLEYKFETKEEAMALALELHARALAGEDFGELIATYGQDPGMVDNPEGYTFEPGAMVSEFTEGTLALEIGEISEPIPAFHGIHIILRTEPNQEGLVMRPGGPSFMDEVRIDAILHGFYTKTQAADIVHLDVLYTVPVFED